MGQLLGEAARAGIFLAGEGLKPSAQRYRLAFRQGKCTVTKGPLTGGNELPAALLVLKVGTIEDALAWARRYGEAAEAEELELGPLTEPWDLGMGPKPPEPVPLRCMILLKATRDSEAGVAPSARQRAALAALEQEMTRAGVRIMAETLRPSSEAVRLRYRGAERHVIDGPFTESKELIGGFSMLRMRSMDELIAWTDRFARILGGECEVDLRPVAEAGDPGRGGR
ncbi:MAG: hypothetical protein IT458_17075, partial [Planctomycetes bacterium]|nr:hypothetical protein [Planctomycetota bacterium]